MAGILGGLRIARRVKRVLVGMDGEGGEIYLEVRAPRMNEIENMGEGLKEPVAPMLKNSANQVVFELNDKGKQVLDGNGSPIPVRNEDDKVYLKKLTRYNTAFNVQLVLTCMEEQVEPSVKICTRVRSYPANSSTSLHSLNKNSASWTSVRSIAGEVRVPALAANVS